jgi:hypothetical protein
LSNRALKINKRPAPAVLPMQGRTRAAAANTPDRQRRALLSRGDCILKSNFKTGG